MDCQGAHEGNVNHIIPLYSGYVKTFSVIFPPRTKLICKFAWYIYYEYIHYQQ
jgi:hypothetical protein